MTCFFCERVLMIHSISIESCSDLEILDIYFIVFLFTEIDGFCAIGNLLMCGGNPDREVHYTTEITECANECYAPQFCAAFQVVSGNMCQLFETGCGVDVAQSDVIELYVNRGMHLK